MMTKFDIKFVCDSFSVGTKHKYSNERKFERNV